MTGKKYDPLWELVGEKSPLQGQEPDLDGTCPHCHVRVHLGSEAKVGARYACGLCGGVSRVVADTGSMRLEAVPD